MATSGQVSSTTAGSGGKSYLYVKWERTGIWNSSDCGSYLKWELWLHNGNYWYSNAIQCYSIYINGSEVYSGGTWSNYTTSGDFKLDEGTTSVQHNNDGTKSFNINFTGWFYSSTNVSGSGDFTLDTIPRYFSQKPTLTLVDKTETSATFNWSTSENCSQVQYRVNNGIWHDVETNINKKSGTYTITRYKQTTNGEWIYLQPNTTYKIEGDFKRKDSGQWSTHGGYNVAVNMQTYNYPNCSSGNNFNIGELCSLEIYNPLNRTFNLIFEIEGGEEFLVENLEGTSYNGFNDNVTIDKLYRSIPNSASGNYSVSIIYGEVSTIKSTNIATYNVVNSEPIFTSSNFTYEDSNSKTLALTGNSSIYVDRYSSNLVTIINSATAQNYASIKSYTLVQGAKSNTYNITGNDTTISMQIDNIDTNTFSVIAIDSRGKSTQVDIELLIDIEYLQYTDLTIQRAIISRDNNGVSESTTLRFNGVFWNNTFGDITNHIKYAKYKYKETTDTQYSQEINITSSVTENSERYSFSGNIVGDEGANGFNESKSYEIILTIQDELSTKTYNLLLGTGTPAIAIYKNSVAIGQKYDTSLGGALQVNGEIYRNGSLVGDGIPTGTEIDYDGSTIPNGWEEVDGEVLKAYTLYENASGNNGTVTLSDNINNYSRIDIWFLGGGHTTGDGFTSYSTSTGSGYLVVDGFGFSGSNDVWYIGVTRYSISGRTIDPVAFRSITYNSGIAVANNSWNYIKKVVGYKED